MAFKIKLHNGDSPDRSTIIKEWRDCTKCEIGKHVRNHVFWDTLPRNAKSVDILMVGEGPGVQEDIENRTFVGTAGKLLREAIGFADPTCRGCNGTGKFNGRGVVKPNVTAITVCPMCNGVGRISIGFVNLVLCRPYLKTATSQANRPPQQAEVMNCLPRLVSTFQTFNPTMIIAVGKEAESYARTVWKEELANIGMAVHFTAIKHPSFICRNGGYTGTQYKAYVKSIENIFDWYREFGIPRLYTPQVAVLNQLIDLSVESTEVT